MKHSVIDLEAGENAAAVSAYNETALWVTMKDIARTQGVATLAAIVDENLEALEAGVQ